MKRRERKSPHTRDLGRSRSEINRRRDEPLLQQLSSGRVLSVGGILVDARAVESRRGYDRSSSGAPRVGFRLSRVLSVGLALASGLLLSVALILNYLNYDYGPISFYIKAKIAGRSTESCVDLPEEIWRRIPACVGAEE